MIVHFKNSLPEGTTIHWHGLRVPAAMDGALTHDQSPIAPGAAFEYDFILPDAGTFWYHPHFDSAAQLGNGLDGPLIVDDPTEPAALGDEVVMVLSDASVDAGGRLEPADSGGDFGTLFGREGNTLAEGLTLRWLPYDRGFGTAYNRPEEDVLRIRFNDEAPAQSPELSGLGRKIPAMDVATAIPVDLSLTLTIADDGALAMGINGIPFSEAGHISARVGERQVWTVRNTFERDHPFQLHGFFFQVLDVNGIAPASREWKDTANAPVDGQMRFVVDFDDRPGMRMFHCHILDHAEAGMMGMILLQ